MSKQEHLEESLEDEEVILHLPQLLKKVLEEKRLRLEELSQDGRQSLQFVQLPVKILESILKYYLPVGDRKNMRLTCHWINNVYNNCPTIGKKFVFHRYNSENLVRDLPNFENIMVTHLEFHGLKEELPKKLWYLCGKRFQSLLFHNSVVGSSAFKNIVLHCLNLKHFHYHRSDICSNTPKFLSGNVIDKLLARKIERKELISFEVCINNFLYPRTGIAYLRPIIWEKIFKIFPCIRTFTENTLYPRNYREDESIPNWVFPRTVENFTPSTFRIPDFKYSGKMWDVRFRKLSMTLKINEEDGIMDLDCILHFFENQTELESLNLNMKFPQYHCLRKMDNGLIFTIKLLDVLQNLPKLKELEFHPPASSKELRSISIAHPTICVRNFSKFIDLVTSMKFVRKNIFLGEDFGLLSEKYTNLKKLCFHSVEYYFLNNASRHNDEQFMLKILDHCSDVSLEHLEFDISIRLTDHILQKVSEMNSLRTLKIIISAKYQWEHSPHVSLANLTNLQHLSILIFHDAFLNSLPEIFPINLRYLDLRFSDEFEHYFESYREEEAWATALNVISANLPSLEILNLNFASCQVNTLEAINFAKYFERLTQVKFLRISRYQFLNENLEILKRLFIACQSLCWIDDDRMSQCFSFDRTSGELRRFSAVETPRRIVKQDPFRPIYFYLESVK